MDNETKELFNGLITGLDRVEQRIYDKLNDMSNQINTLQRDITILKARNDYLDLYALYNQLEKRMTELEKRVS